MSSRYNPLKDSRGAVNLFHVAARLDPGEEGGRGLEQKIPVVVEAGFSHANPQGLRRFSINVHL